MLPWCHQEFGGKNIVDKGKNTPSIYTYIERGIKL